MFLRKYYKDIECPFCFYKWKVVKTSGNWNEEKGYYEYRGYYCYFCRQ